MGNGYRLQTSPAATGRYRLVSVLAANSPKRYNFQLAALLAKPDRYGSAYPPDNWSFEPWWLAAVEGQLDRTADKKPLESVMRAR
jgi:hypothetical protein